MLTRLKMPMIKLILQLQIRLIHSNCGGKILTNGTSIVKYDVDNFKVGHIG